MRELLKPEGDGAEGEEVADAEGRKGLSGKARARGGRREIWAR